MKCLSSPWRMLVVCLPPALVPGLALAGNGYTQYGYGNAAKAMAGVSLALPQDSLISSSNPAGLALVGSRVDFGVDYLEPARDVSISGNRQLTLASADGAWDGNEIGSFIVPEFGISRRHSERLSYGLAIYGNGGLNTDYSTNPYSGFGATGRAGVDLTQIFVSPALSYRLSERQSIGVSINLVYQQLKVYGAEIFATETFPGPYSESPDNVSGNGYDRAYGVGYRLGWLAEPIENLMIGLSWQPQTTMSRFDKYKGLIRDQGRLNSPANYGGGASYRWDSGLVLAFDVQRIDYAKVKSIGTPLQPFLDGALLGADDGPGFGWRNMTIYKFGVAYPVTPQLQLAAGYSDGRQPIPRDQTLFNILTPAILQDHYTVGFTYEVEAYSVGAYYFYGPRQTVRGRNSIPPNQLANPLPPASFGGGEADLHAEAETAGISIGYRF